MPHEQCPMAEVVSRKITHVRNAEVLIQRPGGSRITVIVNIQPLKSAHGEIAGAVNCFFDISERKRNEERLREYVARLSGTDRRKTELLATLASAANHYRPIGHPAPSRHHTVERIDRDVA